MIEVPKSRESVFTEKEQKRGSWLRLVVGAGMLSLGAVAAALGVTSIGYRMTHVVVDNGLINARIVRLQAPVSGDIKALYARPGSLVKTGQVLARINIERTPAEEQVRLQLQRSQDEQIRSQLEQTQLSGELQANSAQLLAARQSLLFLRQQLQSVDNQYTTVQGVDVAIATDAVSQQQAAVDAAATKAASVRADYERYRKLQLEGAISAQKAEQLQYDWQSAQAEVAKAKATLRSTQTALNAAKKGIALRNQNNIGGSVSEQRTQILQAIQAQSVLVSTLEATVASANTRLKQAQTLYKNRSFLWGDRGQYLNRAQQLFQVLSAPFVGVVYSTEREQGEQVNQLEPVLTLLDCNDLWIESVVRADEASRIDPQKPVSVHLNGYSQALVGEVDLMQPISSIQGIEERAKLMQVQALLPAISPTLVGQALMRVTVRIPPPPGHNQNQQFCGVGQSASLTFSKKPFGSI